jgi:hypothetical protein
LKLQKFNRIPVTAPVKDSKPDEGLPIISPPHLKKNSTSGIVFCFSSLATFEIMLSPELDNCGVVASHSVPGKNNTTHTSAEIENKPLMEEGKELGSVPQESSESLHNNSSGRCSCGCVPNIMSLFEMAALRAARKAAAASSSASVIK